MIDPITRKAWTDALISGEYKQGTGTLVSGYPVLSCGHDEHCCLGVLCHINDVDHARWAEINKAYEWIDNVLGSDVRAELVSKNDNMGWSFDEIADWIDANL